MTGQYPLPAGGYAVCSSGGKDSLLALDRAHRAGRRIVRLVTLYDGATQRVRFHGVPITVLHAQADALGLPLAANPTTPETFEEVFLAALADLRAESRVWQHSSLRRARLV